MARRAHPRRAEANSGVVLAVTLALCTPGGVRAAPLASGAGPEIPWLRIVFSLLFCLLLAAAAIHAVRLYQRRGGLSARGGRAPAGNLLTRLRDGPLGHDPQVVILESRRVGPASQVCLVEFDGRQILLGVAQGSVTVIAERDVPEPAEPEDDLS